MNGTNAAVEAVEPTPAAEPNVTVKPSVEFKEETFIEGEWKGFKFITPVFGSLDAAAAHYTPEVILSLVNTQVSARLRSKVKNGLPKNLKGPELVKYQTDKLKERPDSVLLNKEEALAWRPDAREESMGSIFKELKNAIKVGDAVKVADLWPRLATAIEREGGGKIDLGTIMADAMK